MDKCKLPMLFAKVAVSGKVIVGLLCCLAVAGCGGKVEEIKAPAPPKVTVDHPTSRELIDEVDFNGWVQSSAVVEVRARVRGHIKKIHFQDGDLVEAGQLLFELDPRPFQVAIDQHTAQSRAYDAQKSAAEKDVARYTELVKSGGASKQQLEKAEADAMAYDAQIDAMKQQVRQSELDLEFSRITAPIAGRISRAMLTEGNLVNAGGSDPLLTTIVAQNPMFVYFSVDERTLQRSMRQRQKETADAGSLRGKKLPFRFGLDSDDGYPREGVLDFAENQIDSKTGTIEVRGVADNTQGQLVPGSRVKIRVPISEPYSAILVPDTAILSDQDKRYLLVVDEENVVKRLDVTSGRLLDDGMRVILPGSGNSQVLTANDRVVVLGLQRARVNYPVEPIENSTAFSGNDIGTP